MTAEQDPFEDLAENWRPDSLTVVRRVDEAPLVGFADLLDVPTAFPVGAEVPLAWHWFTFTPRLRQAELADDGHPASGALMPEFPHRKRMMAGGSLQQDEAFRVGENYSRRSEVESVTVKSGRSGRMLFVTTRHTYADTGGRQAAVERENAVYRQQAPGQPRQLSAQGPSTEPWHRDRGRDGELDTRTDPRLLFRFSALTNNAHRIHYDAPYAREVEGYPGLVVHGPLLALLMLEQVRRSGRPATSFEYKLLAPAFCGDAVRAVRDGTDMAIGTVGSAAASASGRAD